MLIKYSDNIFKQTVGIIAHNWGRLAFFIVIATFAVLYNKMHPAYGWIKLDLPGMPVTILGAALAIFLGFRNNSAYDRWWEARKIWGGIVNASRTFATMVLSFGSTVYSEGTVDDERVKSWQKVMLYRHIGWLHALRMHLLKKLDQDQLKDYIEAEELEKLTDYTNKPAQLLNKQGLNLQNAYEAKVIEDFRHMELINIIKELYTLQGQAERIKNTVFPYYYNYFTRLFLWLFLLCLPFTLIDIMNWEAIPMSVAISFVFSILEKSGEVTEDPFEGRAADTPMNTIIRSIEIDMRQMMGEKELPGPMPVKTAGYGVQYLD